MATIQPSRIPVSDSPFTDASRFVAHLVRFVWTEAQCCLFAVLIFAGLAVSAVVWKLWDVPVVRYDALLAYVVAVQVVLMALRLETAREVAVICAFHALGLALELFKVHVGSWEYPSPGRFSVAGVPLFAGFMYASVGSYIVAAYRRFGLRVTRFRPVPALALAVVAYLNFFTHHRVVDVRVAVAVAAAVVLWRADVWFTVGHRRHRMPLLWSFLLIGGVIWVAENAATLLGAWRYPNQRDGWQIVHLGKAGSWALLAGLSFVLVHWLGRGETSQPVSRRGGGRFSSR